MLLGVDHADGPPGCCVLRSLSIVVNLFPRCEVLRMADVQRVISTADDVREGHSTTMPSSSCLSQDRSVGPLMRQRLTQDIRSGGGLHEGVLRCANVRPAAG